MPPLPPAVIGLALIMAGIACLAGLVRIVRAIRREILSRRRSKNLHKWVQSERVQSERSNQRARAAGE